MKVFSTNNLLQFVGIILLMLLVIGCGVRSKTVSGSQPDELSDPESAAEGQEENGSSSQNGASEGDAWVPEFDSGVPVAPRCGDLIRQGEEQCDGADLGGATCATLGYGSGELLCDPTLCIFDVALCSVSRTRNNAVRDSGTTDNANGDYGTTDSGNGFNWLDWLNNLNNTGNTNNTGNNTNNNNNTSDSGTTSPWQDWLNNLNNNNNNGNYGGTPTGTNWTDWLNNRRDGG